MECGWDYTLLAPSVIKKFATDKGNANKELMLGAFQEDTGVNLGLLLDSSVKSPITDIADAYFICKYQAEQSQSFIPSKYKQIQPKSAYLIRNLI